MKDAFPERRTLREDLEGEVGRATGAAEIAGLAEVRLGERQCPGLVVAEPEPPELVDPPEDDVPIVVGELDHPDCGCT